MSNQIGGLPPQNPRYNNTAPKSLEQKFDETIQWMLNRHDGKDMPLPQGETLDNIISNMLTGGKLESAAKPGDEAELSGTADKPAENPPIPNKEIAAEIADIDKQLRIMNEALNESGKRETSAAPKYEPAAEPEKPAENPSIPNHEIAAELDTIDEELGSMNRALDEANNSVPPPVPKYEPAAEPEKPAEMPKPEPPKNNTPPAADTPPVRPETGQKTEQSAERMNADDVLKANEGNPHASRLTRDEAQRIADMMNRERGIAAGILDTLSEQQETPSKTNQTPPGAQRGAAVPLWNSTMPYISRNAALKNAVETAGEPYKQIISQAGFNEEESKMFADFAGMTDTMPEIMRAMDAEGKKELPKRLAAGLLSFSKTDSAELNQTIKGLLDKIKASCDNPQDIEHIIKTDERFSNIFK